MASTTQSAVTPSSEVSGDASIVCSDLVRIYSSDGVEVQALQGLNLKVASGEMVAIVGASGSGKSTLLGILSGLDKPTAGSAIVAGRDLVKMSKSQRIEYLRFGVGFVWQQTARNLLPYLTARENVALPMVLAGTHKRDRAERAGELLDLLEIGHTADRKPSEMSGGEQQRAAIAIALSNAPHVLLADEPTGELDDATSAEVLEAMRRVSSELGVTTLIVTHDPTVSEHVTRTVQIRDGRTSSEVLRRSVDGDAANGQLSAQTYTVIDDLGRLQLPQEYVTNLHLRDRVRLALEADHVGVFPGRGRHADPNARPETEPARDAAPSPEAAPTPEDDQHE